MESLELCISLKIKCMPQNLIPSFMRNKLEEDVALETFCHQNTLYYEQSTLKSIHMTYFLWMTSSRISWLQ